MDWTHDMYRYLSLRALSEVFENTSTHTKDENTLATLIDEIKSRLDPRQINFVNHRLRKLKNEYSANIYAQVESDYDRWDETYEDEYYPPIEYDEKTYNVWTKAVRGRITVNVTYESTTSGITQRLVDPYKTSSPYGDGYCHLKNEVRKFRLDRIIEISLTNKTFVKPIRIKNSIHVHDK